MDISVNETRNENREKTNVRALIAFLTFFVVAIFMLLINSKPDEKTKILQQKYFWNIHIFDNIIFTLIANGFLYIILVIFRKSGKTVVWCIFTIPLMFLSILLAVLGLMILENATYHAQPLWFSFLLFLVIAFVFELLLWKYKVNINLVTEIIGKSLKGVDVVKAMSIIPVVNSLILLIPMNLYYSSYESIKHHDNSIILITISFILIIFFMVEFQKFLVAGVTTKSYFTRDKSSLGHPILSTFLELVKFHLGSVCYGAMIKGFRPFLRFVSHILKTFNLTNNANIISLANWLDVHTVSNNAYVFISKEGVSYFESGKMLLSLQSRDAINAERLNNTKSTTIFIVKFFLWTVIATTQALAVENDGKLREWRASSAEVFITLVYIFCMVSFYMDYIETITDSTIINACVDYEANDGSAKPYFMSKNLEELILRLKMAEAPQIIIPGTLSLPQASNEEQVANISTIYNPSAQSSQQSINILYLPDFGNQIRDELIPTQHFQPSAPQFDA